MADQYELRLPALALRQGTRTIYSFGIDGKKLHAFATVSRVHRDEAILQGYQRPEVLNHIRAIRRYLESEGALLPNAIVLAFDDRIRFEAYRRRSPAEYSIPGELVIPIDESLDDSQKPALIVDGQQRSAAIRDANVAEYPVAAVGFIAGDEDEQRAQFILVNSTKPLPKGLIHELLPDTAGQLPPQYAKKRLPAYLMMRLNVDHDSPFRTRIATPTAPTGYIKDNSVLKMVENSLYEGALYQYRDAKTGEGDMEQMLLHLKYFWTLVEFQWPIEWSLPPRKSRLTHGVGVQSLGFVMDSLSEGTTAADLPGLEIERVLSRLSSKTAWTEGSWEFGRSETRRWNGLQNTPNDVRLLTNFLLIESRKTS